MFAQALVESGALNAIGASAQQAAASVRHWLETVTATQWGVVAAVVFILLVVWNHRRASRYLD